MEGDGSSGEQCAEIETNAHSLNVSIVFHILKDAVGFVLYMHQQIPSILQDMSLEFDGLHAEYKELEMEFTQTELKASARRKHISRMREVKHNIRRWEKLMNTISRLETALQLMISEIPNVESVILVLGGSPLRPQHVYELFFSHGKCVPSGSADFTKTKAAEGLSRKAIRALISKDAGSSSYPGPTKLFLLVKAPSSFNLPLHFLPKRDFRYSKKIVPFRLKIKCRTLLMELEGPALTYQTGSSVNLIDSTNDSIWFQCRHVIRGLAFQELMEE